MPGPIPEADHGLVPARTSVPGKVIIQVPIVYTFLSSEPEYLPRYLGRYLLGLMSFYTMTVLVQ